MRYFSGRLLIVPAIVLFLLPSAPLAQSYQDATVVWRGFDQDWGYNHRWNRHGDYIHKIKPGPQSCEAELVHTAASGTGPDHAHYTTRYTQIAANNVGFQNGSTTFSISGKEQQDISKSITIAIKADSNMQNRSQYQALLGGFDFYAVDSADKIKYFHLSVGNASYDRFTKQIKFTIDVTLNLACDSPECPSTKEVDYQARVDYLVVGGDSDLAVHNQNYAHSYNWNNQDEYSLSPKTQVLEGASDNQFAQAILAFSELKVNLDTYHHMLSWVTTIRPIGYDRQQGKYEFHLDLMFKQWADGMGWTHPPESWFSYKDSGTATLNARVVLLQLKDAAITHKYYRSSIFWEGWGSKADTDKAIKEYAFSFSY